MNIVKLLKKNISIIIPAAIVILAALLLIPTIMMRKKISQQLEASRKLGNEVESAIKSAVSAKQSEIAKVYEDTHQKDANSIQQLTIQSTQRELLSYKIFPDTNETSMQIFNEFKRAYNQAFADMIKDMNALDAPTDIEIRQEAGSVQIGTEISQSPETSDEKIVELLCEKRSKEIPVYANPQVFSGYAFWNNWEYSGTKQAVRDCWFCQLAYWIHRDIVDSIININSGSNSIASSSVKRLLGIRFQNRNASTVELEAGTKNNSDELPSYVTDKIEGLCRPWTARTSNEQIDIAHFSLAVIIEPTMYLNLWTSSAAKNSTTFQDTKTTSCRNYLNITRLQSSKVILSRFTEKSKTRKNTITDRTPLFI